jgi:hypothetical protein
MCRRAVLIATVLCTAVTATLAQTTKPATEPTAGTKIIAPASRPSTEGEQALNDLNAYLSAHRDELKPRLEALKFDPEGAPEEYAKLKPLLPTELAGRVDLAIPALHERRVNSQIVVNLRYIGAALTSYLTENHDRLPDGLGQLVRLVPSTEVFILPEAKLPLDVKQSAPEQQTPWINAHSIFAFPAAGTRPDATPPGGLLAYERLDLDPVKPKLAVLFGDGHVDTMPREELEKMLKR